MGTTLKWEPLSEHKNTLQNETKYILRDRFGPTISELLNNIDIDYLEGVIAGTASAAVAKDCRKLVEQIEKYGEIKLWEF